jgi:hypothetical protein
VGSGMQTAANEVFSFTDYPAQFDPEYIKKRMSGEIIEKYTHKDPQEYILYFEDVAAFEELSQSLQDHLSQYKDKLESRAQIKRSKGSAWWKYTFPMHKEYYSYPKIWCSYRARENIFCLDESNEYIGLTNTTAIFGTNNEMSLKYVLALVNSKLLDFRYKAIGKQTGGGVYEYFENQISKLPIPSISQELQKPFIALVNQIIGAKKNNEDTTGLENQIDCMVYELYGLSEDEIKMIDPA